MPNKYLAFILPIILAIPLAQAQPPVPYPKDYRNWRHVKTMVIQTGHPLENPFLGIHHIYANAAAQAGLASGKFENGAILVFDLLNTVHEGKTLQEGKRKLVGVMVHDAEAYAKTGGWGFEGFAGDSHDQRLTNDGGAGCFGCHTSQRDHGFVFTRNRN